MTKTQHELQVAVADLSSKEQMMRDKVAASADARRARLKVAEKVKAGKREILMAQLAEVSDPLPSYFATFNHPFCISTIPIFSLGFYLSLRKKHKRNTSLQSFMLKPHARWSTKLK